MKKKQAVVVIHGMGEQIPMETLTSFVDAVWTSDPELVDVEKFDPETGNKSWIKPDNRTRSFELRRFTTEDGAQEKRTDFYEYYWAHQMTDTSWQQVRAWFVTLLWRNPFRDVPRGMLGAWFTLWVVALFAIGVTIYSLLSPSGESVHWFWKLLAAGGAVAWGVVLTFIIAYFGDVARYVRAKPANVGIRQEIRENGIQLLETLMGRKDDGTWGECDYDRIVVAAHSLGSVIGYDILSHTFSRLNKEGIANSSAPQPERIALEAAIDAAAKGGELNLNAFQEAQERARRELNAAGNPWIVSDFITMGCPLVHSEFLIVRNRHALGEAKRQRMLPTCPPTLEDDPKTERRHFTYRLQPTDPADAPRVPHHAALFAYTRWSNLYSPSRWLFWGDIFSGPLGDAMGLEKEGDSTGTVSGIRDVQVMPCGGGGWPPRLAHTRYWEMEKAGKPKDGTTEPSELPSDDATDQAKPPNDVATKQERPPNDVARGQERTPSDAATEQAKSPKDRATEQVTSLRKLLNLGGG